MKKIISILTIALATLAINVSAQNVAKTDIKTTKKERNYVKDGNKAFADKEYEKAIEYFNKALAISPANDVIVYNIAASQFEQARKLMGANVGNDVPEMAGKLIASADSTYVRLFNNTANQQIKELSAYNSGNIAYSQQNYGRAVEQYKNALRVNPDNDKARQNLRLAQLKLQQQQNQQDQNQDQNQDQDKQDQQQQQQQQQDQQQQDQDKQQDQQQQKQEQNQQQQQQQSISQQNAEQILKAMENAESATRRKAEQRKAEEEARNASRRVIEKPW